MMAAELRVQTMYMMVVELAALPTITHMKEAEYNGSYY
jgi:hypothetical protein